MPNDSEKIEMLIENARAELYPYGSIDVDSDPFVVAETAFSAGAKWALSVNIKKLIHEDPQTDSTPQCHMCGAKKDFAHGYGSYSGPATNGGSVYLCHPNDPNLPDCYTIFTRGH